MHKRSLKNNYAEETNNRSMYLDYWGWMNSRHFRIIFCWFLINVCSHYMLTDIPQRSVQCNVITYAHRNVPTLLFVDEQMGKFVQCFF